MRARTMDDWLEKRKKRRKEVKGFIRYVKHLCLRHDIPLETALRNIGFVRRH